MVECICCSEIVWWQNSAKRSRPGGLEEPPVCITQHPGFSAVCLNRWVLQTAWYQYKQQYAHAYKGPDHKQKRPIAYRQLARWCWGLLGKQIRVVLPSCGHTFHPQESKKILCLKDFDFPTSRQPKCPKTDCSPR